MVKDIRLLLFALLALAISCKKKTDVTTNPPGTPEIENYDTTGTLKDAADFPVGIGVRYDLMTTDPVYAAIVKREFDNVTVENELKHVSVVANDGSFNYTKADQLVNQLQAAGLGIYGHPLVFFQSNNVTFLRSQTKFTNTANAVVNGGFESGSGNTFTNWFTQVTGSANGSVSSEASDVYEGSRAMRVTVNTPGANPYDIQAVSDVFPVSTGSSYTASFYAKAATASQLKLVVQNTTYQEKVFTIGTTWQKYSYTFTSPEPSLTIRFHFPSAGTFIIDSVYLAVPITGTYVIDPVKIDTAMKRYITNTVTRYKGKMIAWDVVNEPLNDNTGVIKNNPNPGTNNGDEFYWAEYLGNDYISKAVQYARAADATTPLFINESNLESDLNKLNGMISLINDLKSKGTPIDGIGLQMHITTFTNPSGIDQAFAKLAATGLKIKVTELDVRVNPYNFNPFNPTQEQFTLQSDVYRYVARSYRANVPAAQRFGISVWDLSDKDSWIVTTQGKVDFPTLFSSTYTKKPSYYGFLVGLKKR
jgi:endo-1,4-beta-xylanase